MNICNAHFFYGAFAWRINNGRVFGHENFVQEIADFFPIIKHVQECVMQCSYATHAFQAESNKRAGQLAYVRRNTVQILRANYYAQIHVAKCAKTVRDNWGIPAHHAEHIVQADEGALRRILLDAIDSGAQFVITVFRSFELWLNGVQLMKIWAKCIGHI